MVSYLCEMVLLGRTSNKLRNLDYDKMHVEKIQFLPTIFDGDPLFELLLVLPQCSWPFENVGHRQKVRWACLVQGDHDQYQK
jgi:hypothetical protein